MRPVWIAKTAASSELEDPRGVVLGRRGARNEPVMSTLSVIFVERVYSLLRLYILVSGLDRKVAFLFMLRCASLHYTVRALIFGS